MVLENSISEGLIDINIYFTNTAAGSELQHESVEEEAALRSIHSRHIVGADTDNVRDIRCRNDIVERAHYSTCHWVGHLLDRKLKKRYIRHLIRRSKRRSRTHHCALGCTWMIRALVPAHKKARAYFAGVRIRENRPQVCVLHGYLTTSDDLDREI